MHIRYICLRGRLVYFSLLSRITKLMIEYSILNTREGQQTVHTAKGFYGLKYGLKRHCECVLVCFGNRKINTALDFFFCLWYLNCLLLISKKFYRMKLINFVIQGMDVKVMFLLIYSRWVRLLSSYHYIMSLLSVSSMIGASTVFPHSGYN